MKKSEDQSSYNHSKAEEVKIKNVVRRLSFHLIN